MGDDVGFEVDVVAVGVPVAAVVVVFVVAVTGAVLVVAGEVETVVGDEGDGDVEVAVVGENDGEVVGDGPTFRLLGVLGLLFASDTFGLGELIGPLVATDGPPTGPELPVFGANATGPFEAVLDGAVCTDGDEVETLGPVLAGASTVGVTPDSVTPLLEVEVEALTCE